MIGSWGEQITNSDIPAESAEWIPVILGSYVCIRSRGDGDDSYCKGNGNGNSNANANANANGIW